MKHNVPISFLLRLKVYLRITALDLRSGVPKESETPTEKVMLDLGRLFLMGYEE